MRRNCYTQAEYLKAVCEEGERLFLCEPSKKSSLVDHIHHRSIPRRQQHLAKVKRPHHLFFHSKLPMLSYSSSWAISLCSSSGQILQPGRTCQHRPCHAASRTGPGRFHAGSSGSDPPVVIKKEESRLGKVGMKGCEPPCDISGPGWAGGIGCPRRWGRPSACLTGFELNASISETMYCE